MKRLIFPLLLLLSCICGYAKVSQTNDDPISAEDKVLLEKAIGLVDQGQSLAALQDFTLLAGKYPDNYIIQYERLYCLYMLQRYDEVIKEAKSLLKHERASDLAYHIVGNAYDHAGNRKKAISTYQEGLSRFPKSGVLYMELGNISLSEGDHPAAIDYYNSGIVAQPNFASNYYRAALLFLLSSNMKVWGLVYGESAILLAPSDKERHKIMSHNIVECLKENIHFNYGDSSNLRVALVPSREISVNRDGDSVYLAFQGIYEGALARPLKKLFDKKIAFVCNIPQLIEIRKGLVESYFSVTDNLYGNSMYLLEFQKEVIDSGHWDAYNYFLFSACYPDEFQQWLKTHRSMMEDFIKWYNKHPYSLGNGRSVDQTQIFNSYRPLGLLQAMTIQAKLLSDIDVEDMEEN